MWEALADQIEKDPESVKVLGWVREMYAFSLALALSHTTVDLTVGGQDQQEALLRA